MLKTIARFILTCLFLIIAVCSVLFFVVRWNINHNPEAYINSTWRAQAIYYPGLRNLLALHNDGDAKTDYLSQKYPNIILEIDTMEGFRIPETVVKKFAQRIQQLTGKEVIIDWSDENIPLQKTISEEQLYELFAKYKDNSPHDDLAVIYLLVMNEEAESGKILGTTISENGIGLFYNSILEFTDKQPQTTEQFLYSTLLHEFGHQLGLKHNKLPRCLMNERAEIKGEDRFDPRTAVDDFCASEMEEIAKIKDKNY